MKPPIEPEDYEYEMFAGPPIPPASKGDVALFWILAICGLGAIIWGLFT